MQAGQLRESIDIERYTVSRRTDGGEEVKTWALLETLRASITPVRSEEREAGQQKRALAKYTVEVRYTPTEILRRDRIKWGTRYLEIVDVRIDPHLASRVIDAVEQVL